MKNQLHYSFLLCLTVIGLLLILSYFSRLSIGPFSLKKIDLLADIRPPGQPAPADSLIALQNEIPDSIVAQQDSIVQEIREHCPPGITCIEDYSSDSTALKYFFTALQQTKKSGQPLRVAFYGDSFIEGDVFCGSFRDTLQSLYGGRGVGYMPITSDVAGFRNTIKHRFSNWGTSSLVKIKDSLAAPPGPAGFCFVPLPGNWVEYKPSKKRYLREFNDIRIYYRNLKDAILHYSIDTVESMEPLEVSDNMQEWRYEGKQIKSVKFEFFPHDSLLLYGASFESGSGIYVDNFSMRGNSGLTLTTVDADLYRQFNRYRKYKLIILQFGLNLIVEESLNYQAYTTRMVAVVNKMKTLFPATSFLLLSVSDRSSNTDGDFKTMRAIPAMRNAQRLIAQETGIAFWDMYQAMGGENSMVKFVTATPALAAKDYTHLTFKGGRKVAGSLVKSLLVEVHKYERK
jgi:lysophospholipase L1-like esterase